MDFRFLTTSLDSLKDCVCVRVCTHVHVCVCAYVCIHEHVCEGQRSMLGVLFNYSRPQPFIDGWTQGLLVHLDPVDLARLAGQHTPGISCFCPSSAGIIGTCCHS